MTPTFITELNFASTKEEMDKLLLSADKNHNNSWNTWENTKPSWPYAIENVIKYGNDKLLSDVYDAFLLHSSIDSLATLYDTEILAKILTDLHSRVSDEDVQKLLDKLPTWNDQLYTAFKIIPKKFNEQQILRVFNNGLNKEDNRIEAFKIVHQKMSSEMITDLFSNRYYSYQPKFLLEIFKTTHEKVSSELLNSHFIKNNPDFELNTAILINAPEKISNENLQRFLKISTYNFSNSPNEWANIIDLLLSTQIERISDKDLVDFISYILGSNKTKSLAIELLFKHISLNKIDAENIIKLLIDQQYSAQTLEKIKNTFSEEQILKLADKSNYYVNPEQIILQNAFPNLSIIKDFSKLPSNFAEEENYKHLIQPLIEIINKKANESPEEARTILSSIISSGVAVQEILELEVFKDISNLDITYFSTTIPTTPEVLATTLKFLSESSKGLIFFSFLSNITHNDNDVEIFKIFLANGAPFPDFGLQLNSNTISLAKKLYEQSAVPTNEIVKLLSLSHGGYSTIDSEDVFDLDLINEQIALFEQLINDGLDINSLSFSDLKIDNLHTKTMTRLLELGLDSNALFLADQLNDDDAIELIEKYQPSLAKKWPIMFIGSEIIIDLTSDTLFKYLNLSEFDPNFIYSSEKLLNDLKEAGQKFYDAFTKDAVTSAMLDERYFGGQGTILHILTQLNKEDILADLIEKYPSANINALNANGQTPLFYCQTPETIELLINAGADTTISDNKGKTCFSSPNLNVINWLVEHKFLEENHVASAIYEHLIKGNFEHVTKLLTITDEDHIHNLNEIDVAVDAIHIGLSNSVEPNKYMALTHLLTKAGITIPQQHFSKLKAVRDINDAQEFKFLDGLLHKLAKYYLDRNANEDSYKGLTSALSELDNDFALEILTINGMFPQPFPNDISVFRGMKFSLDENGIGSFFDHGHRAFSMGQYQKILGYYVREPWNPEANEKGHWELGGTYLSFEPVMASSFACGITASFGAQQEQSLLLEARFSSGYPAILGKNYYEYEIVPAYMKGAEIIAIYKLQCKKPDHFSTEPQGPVVEEVFINPNIDVPPTYQVDDVISLNQAAIDTYTTLKELIKPEQIFNRYIDAEDFYAKYTEADFAKDQEKLWEFYFSGRTPYEEDVFAKSCDPELYCC